MALRLSERDLSTLTAAMTVMLTPFCYADGEQWRSAVCSVLANPMHSVGVTFALAAPNEPFIAGPPDIVSALQVLLPPPDWMLEALERRRRMGLNVAGFSEIYNVQQVKRTAFYNDVVIPNRLLAPLSLAADFPGLPLPALIGVMYEDERIAARELPRQKQMLSVLVPGFIAGVGTHLQLGRQRAALASILDSVSAGITIVDVDGNVLDENHAMRTLMAVDPDRNHVRAAVKQLSLGAKDSVLTVTEPVPSRTLTSDQLESRFGLTRREVETAQLIARGHSNREIAAAMGISLNTARRHSEQVLLKLNIHSRAAVAARMGGAT